MVPLRSICTAESGVMVFSSVTDSLGDEIVLLDGCTTP